MRGEVEKETPKKEMNNKCIFKMSGMNLSSAFKNVSQI